METNEIITILISSIALIVSIIAILINSLIPFRPRVTNSSPEFSIYKITPNISGTEDGKTWWIPSFNVSFSMYNIGKRTGKIRDFRIVVEINQNRSKQRYDFYPKWILDFSKFQKYQTERFVWIEEAVISDWYPIILFGNKEMRVDTILEGPRWDNKLNGLMKFKLEYISSQKEKWIELDSYELTIDEDMFEDKSTYTPFDKRIEKYRNLN